MIKLYRAALSLFSPQRTMHPRCKEVVYYSAKDNADEGDTPNKIAPDYV